MINLSRSVSSFLKGVGAGAAIGAVTVAAVSGMKVSNKSARKKISNAVKTASDFMDNISYMLK